MELEEQPEMLEIKNKEKLKLIARSITETDLKSDELSEIYDTIKKHLHDKRSKNKIKSKPQKGKYDSKRLALGRVISSPFKTNVVEALTPDKSLSASELFKKSGASSEGTFHYHLRDLKWLGVVDYDEGYKLTDFGTGVSDSLAKLE